MTIGDRIRNQREHNGLTQTELAEKIKVSKQTLYKYENNIVTNIPSDKIEDIAKILDVSPSYLMGWEDNLTSENADLIPDILCDGVLIEHIKKMKHLDKEHLRTIYDTISYWYEKEGH